MSSSVVMCIIDHFCVGDSILQMQMDCVAWKSCAITLLLLPNQYRTFFLMEQ